MYFPHNLSPNDSDCHFVRIGCNGNEHVGERERQGRRLAVARYSSSCQRASVPVILLVRPPPHWPALSLPFSLFWNWLSSTITKTLGSDWLTGNRSGRAQCDWGCPHQSPPATSSVQRQNDTQMLFDRKCGQRFGVGRPVARWCWELVGRSVRNGFRFLHDTYCNP